MIIFTCLGVGLVLFLILYISKRLYMSIQWGKLKKEVEKVNSEPLSGHELMFEFTYLKERELELHELELSLFPYLKSKKRRSNNEMVN